MQELINQLVEKVGLSPETAEKATTVVVNFMKDKLPAGFSDKVQGLLNGDFDLGAILGGSENATDGATGSGNPLDKLKGMFGQ